MIELTTGVVFLMSSLYGSQNGDMHAKAGDTAEPKAERAEEIESSFQKNIATDPKAMEAYLRKEFADTPILVDIARCESSFRQFDADGDVIRGKVNPADVGVMQINEKYHAAMAKKLGIDIYTIPGNIEYARHLYRESGGQPWIASSPCWSKELATNK